MERFSHPNGILAFVTVAQEGSVSRAAQVLNLTQPAVSHQIRRLAEETGITLFRRTPRGLVPTPEARAILPEAEAVLAAMSAFRRSTMRQSGRVSGRLRIGTIVDPGFIRSGQLLNRLGAACPGISTELVHGVSGEILRKLRQRQIDAGFYLFDPAEFAALGSDMHVRRLADFDYRVVAPPGWQDRVAGADWTRLAGLPWIGTPPASVHQRLLGRIFADHGCRQNSVALVDHEASMLEMVRAGVGLSLCRESVAVHEVRSNGLVLCEGLAVPACLSLLTLKDRADDPVIAAMLGELATVWTGDAQGAATLPRSSD
ncbi:LysR family transcriptional regulator [Paracoccus sp. 1_MG-2023]|uniref:LysR family transcriptional regulator n=1 Tax=unclassified Paracoccus (in: a-proteobacteria) TaxID=2688777 RepID=UPI001C09F6CC|nr:MULTISPECIES: LysR family transcriptional regulator [unclassified Paracoccus (in: a-proteobacteria)]MBU2957445.1 LysR family transcriptional regulator [Paracoccus sp. C2R09]MDO6669643.1 LysR family transcriptional regulator [Paracoccus sp. 1_MG-2023]